MLSKTLKLFRCGGFCFSAFIYVEKVGIHSGNSLLKGEYTFRQSHGDLFFLVGTN